MFNLFLDDERDPSPSCFCEWIVARSYQEAVQLVLILGAPQRMSLDHDLGSEKTGYDFVKWLIEYHLDRDIEPEFDFYIHSQNPVGRDNITAFLEGFRRYISTSKG